MNKEEFMNRAKGEKIGSNTVVAMNTYCNAPNCNGCFFNGQNWVVYENDERGKHDDMLVTEVEDEAFQFLYDYLVGMSFA